MFIVNWLIVTFFTNLVLYLVDTEWMQNLFAPCATLRLFLPEILINYKSLVYLDTDIILLRSIQELWKEFDSFSKTALIGMSPTNQLNDTNTGVILMNLTRMREAEWTQKIRAVARTISNQITYPVQV